MTIKPIILIIACILLFSISVTSSDNEMVFSPVILGDDEIYFTEQAGDLELGTFWRYVSGRVDVIPGARGTQSQPIYTSTPYYDLKLSGLYPRYMQGSNIKFNITIINKGDEPDRDAILEYWMADPSGTVHFKSREVEEEVPPTCPGGRWNTYIGKCIGPDGIEFAPFLIIKERTMVLSRNATEGEWKMVVTYETEVQELINVFQTFEVGAFPYFIISAVAIFTIFGLVFGGKLYVKEKRKRRRKVEEIIKETEG